MDPADRRLTSADVDAQGAEGARRARSPRCPARSRCGGYPGLGGLFVQFFWELYKNVSWRCKDDEMRGYETTFWGVRLRKRFYRMFSESSPCLLWQHSSCSTTQRPAELSENILQNIFHNLSPKTVLFIVLYSGKAI